MPEMRVSDMKNELYHHGILNMRWGHRNGPPYPLEPNKKSKEEIIRDIDAVQAYKRLSEFDDKELEQLVNRISKKRTIAEEYAKISTNKKNQVKNTITGALNALAAGFVIKDYIKGNNGTNETDVIKAIVNTVKGTTPTQKKGSNNKKEDKDIAERIGETLVKATEKVVDDAEKKKKK